MTPEPTSNDPLWAALERVGDRWSLLVVAALGGGPRRFGELQGVIPGIATNVLSARLRALGRDGVVVAERYSQRPDRFAYRLSAAGQALSPAVRVLTQWGAALLGVEPGASSLRHGPCGTVLTVRWYCPTCGLVVEDEDLGVEDPGEGVSRSWPEDAGDDVVHVV